MGQDQAGHPIEALGAQGGEPPQRANVSIGNARSLTLRVIVVPKAQMPGGREDSTELDNAVWARPLLIR